jgi:hypothetical protein
MKYLSLFLLVFALQSFAIEAGLYNFYGEHSQYGAYKGLLELRPRADGAYDVIRVSTYENYTFEGLQIQEVWTGVGQFTDGAISLQFHIKQADFLSSANGLARTPEQFKSDLRVSVSYQNDLAVFNLGEGRYQEKLSLQPSPLLAEPLWKNQRYIVESTGKTLPGIASLGYLLMLPIIHKFRKIPEVKIYADRPEFKSKKQFLVVDSTDYDFYQKNKHLLRVVNKISDQVSLVEAASRRNAFAHTLSEKAEYFEQRMVDFHLNELGMFARTGLLPDGDGALWTGMYVGSQAMRYLATKEQIALDHVRSSLQGMMLLMDVTEDPSEFARYVKKYQPTDVIEGVWRRGVGPYSDYAYIIGGNNDMFKGIIQAFAWAMMVLPDQDPLWPELIAHAKRVPALKIAEKINNRIPAFGLQTLAYEKEGNRSEAKSARKLYNKAVRKGTFPDAWGLEQGFYYGGIADFSGINLGMVAGVTNVILAKMLGEEKALRHFQEGLLSTWQTYAPIRRDFLTVAAYTFAYREGAHTDDFDQQLWDVSLSQSLWSLRDVPAPRNRYAVTFDFSLKPDWCLSAWPDLPWKRVKNPPPPWEYHFQGAYDYPIYESLVFGSTFLWKDGAYGYKGSTPANDEAPPGDYLYVYWMARFGGLTQ